MKIKLYGSLRSPFARRARLMLEELGVEHDFEVVDVFNPPAAFLEVNPLGRVPALRLADGRVLIDSWAIHAYFEARHGAHPLFLFGGAGEAAARRVTALAVGVMEHAVMAFLKYDRDEALAVVGRALRTLEGEALGPYFFGDRLGCWDLDLGAALAYCDLRLGRSVVDGHPKLRAYLEALSARPSFRKTVPPA
jgi:glutathione S-transferase